MTSAPERRTAPVLRRAAVTSAAVLLGVTAGGAAGAAAAPATGIITTVAGGGPGPSQGDGGPATGAILEAPSAVAVAPDGSLYIADTSDNEIRKVTPDGKIHVFAGSFAAGYSGDGGPATAAELSAPQGVAVDAAGDVYIADTGNLVVREVTPNDTITTVAGGGSNAVPTDGSIVLAGSASFATPSALAVDPAGNVYITDPGSWQVDELTTRTVRFNSVPITLRVVVSVTGSHQPGTPVDGQPALGQAVNYPTGVALDSTGALYIADYGNSLVEKIAGGVVTTYSEVAYPTGIAVAPGNIVEVSQADFNQLLSLVPPAGSTVVAGTGAPGYTGDGGPAPAATLQGPTGLATDTAGDTFVADSANNVIREIGGAAPPTSVPETGATAALGGLAMLIAAAIWLWRPVRRRRRAAGGPL